MLPARTVIIGSHPRDLASPCHRRNFLFSKNMLISKKKICPRIHFPSWMVMIFNSSNFRLNNIICPEELRGKVTLVLNPGLTNSFQFPVLTIKYI